MRPKRRREEGYRIDIVAKPKIFFVTSIQIPQQNLIIVWRWSSPLQLLHSSSLIFYASVFKCISDDYQINILTTIFQLHLIKKFTFAIWISYKAFHLRRIASYIFYPMIGEFPKTRPMILISGTSFNSFEKSL